MNLDWSTLALQTVNFLVLVWLLQRFLYRPVLAVIDRRRAETQSLHDRALEAEHKAEAAEREWRRRAEALEIDAARLRGEAEDEARGRAEMVMAQARCQADRIRVEARETIDAERTAAAADLRTQAAGVATVLATRMLEVVAPGVGAAPFLARLIDRLAVMAPADRALLGQDMARVEIAPPLPAEAQEYWSRRLAEYVGDVSFVDAPELIAGVRLATPSAALEVSWADTLARAREGMAGDAEPD